MPDASATDRVRRSLDQAISTQDTLNAFTSIEEEAALSRAAAIDEQGAGGPLAGVPIGLKDIIDHEGRVTTCGSAFYRSTASASASAVARLEAAGAVIVGRTGLHEFAYGFSSENQHFGAVRNPWDPTTSPGGSSGGSAAAVAAGIVPVAIGTDTGGSVRVPAALCGCYGLKVTYGRIPLEGVFPLVASIDTVGPLANGVDDLALAYRVMSGDDRPDPQSKPLRIGIPQPLYDEGPVSTAVDDAFGDTVDALRLLGHAVHPIELPDVVPGREIGFATAPEVRAVHRGFREQGLPYGDEVATRLDECDLVSDEEAALGRTWQQTIRSRFADAFETVDLMLTPTVPAMRKEIGVDVIDGLHYRLVLSWFTSVVNHALVPAIALPLAGTGTPPVSLQVIGPMGSEPALIGFARDLESRRVAGFVSPNVQPG